METRKDRYCLPGRTRALSLRSGMILWLVVGLATVMGVLAFAFHLLVADQNVKAHLVYFSLAAHGLAEAGVNHAVEALRAELARPSSATLEALLRAEPGDLGEPPLPSSWREPLTALLAREASGSVDVGIRIEDVRPLREPVDPGQGFDPGEKRATAVFTSTGTYRGLSQTIVERRPLKVVSLALPVVSRFTLFVKSPEPTDVVWPGYNRFANDITGAPDWSVPSSGNVLPLVLFNHGPSPRVAGDPKDNGYVFLGGSNELQLHLTSGGHYQYGEYFHFYNFLALDTSRPAAFLNDSPPPYFRSPQPTPSGSMQFQIKHAFFGYFTRDLDASTPGDMNKDGVLRAELDAGSNLRSSVLHLYGSALDPSPTRVFGNVYHSYPIYSAITVDADRDGARDAVVGLLPAVREEDYAFLDTTDPLPARVPSLVQPGTILDLDPEAMTYARLFGSHAGYAAYQSLLVTREPYNTGVDYLRSLGEFPPRSPQLSSGDYPNPGDQVRLDSWQDGVACFSGDLNRLDPAVAFSGKAVVVVEDEAELFDLFLDEQGRLDLGAVVEVRQGDVTLPSSLEVVRGGTLICRGDIRVEALTVLDRQVPLTLCSLSGDVLCSFDGPVEAALVALRGRVRTTVPDRPVDILGGLAAGQLPAKSFPAGGSLRYDTRLNPSELSFKALYRGFVADRAEDWSL